MVPTLSNAFPDPRKHLSHCSALSLGTRGRLSLPPTPHHYLGSHSSLPACLGSWGGKAKGMCSSQHFLKLTLTFSPSPSSESIYFGSLALYVSFQNSCLDPPAEQCLFHFPHVTVIPFLRLQALNTIAVNGLSPRRARVKGNFRESLDKMAIENIILFCNTSIILFKKKKEELYLLRHTPMKTRSIPLRNMDVNLSIKY